MPKYAIISAQQLASIDWTNGEFIVQDIEGRAEIIRREGDHFVLRDAGTE